MNPLTGTITIEYPRWLDGRIAWQGQYQGDDEKMALVFELMRLRAQNHAGTPFSAALFQGRNGRLVSVGVNLSDVIQVPFLHAPLVAIAMGCKREGRVDLRAGDYHLFLSCEPCEMCRGAIVLARPRRLVCAASDDDARKGGHERGPTTPTSLGYLRDAGIEVVLGVERTQGRQWLRRPESE